MVSVVDSARRLPSVCWEAGRGRRLAVHLTLGKRRSREVEGTRNPSICGLGRLEINWEHFEELSRGRLRDEEQRHKLEFPSWFEKWPDPVNGSEVGSSRSRLAQIEVDDVVDDDLDEEKEEDEDEDEDEEEWRMTFCLATTIQTMSDKCDVLHYIFNSDGLFSMASTRSRTRRIEATAPHGRGTGSQAGGYGDLELGDVSTETKQYIKARLQDDFGLNYDRLEDEKSEINRRNRSKLTVYHTTGTKSFARKRHELLGAVQIDEVGPADLYAASHKRKNGEWICDAARMNFEKMMEVEAQATMEGRTLTDVEVFTQVLGEKRGYVRGLGDSVWPVSTSCSSSSADMARRLTETQLELEQIRADREKESQEQMHEIHSLQQKMEEMQERMARYDRFMSRFASGAFDDAGV
ncbi:hypothetical protein CJ030_MR6G022459 [Morella rubra]|uniref:Uncharacterized protein n=1 Tax=Morella rubra TaxID=262757 RepID=A0A6A1VG33_9ROSI|nr:hypothetical protein CJ030_MR6G022459 [Morella rubra]